MNPVHNILNKVNEWNDPSYSAFTRHIGTRATNLLVTTPLEALAVAQNVLIIAPIQVVGMTLKAGARVIEKISGSEAVKNFADQCPGLSDLMQTVARTIAYAIGTLLSATLGVISPTTNYRVQQALGPVFQKIEAQAEAVVVAAEDKTQSALNTIAQKAEDAGNAVDHAAEKAADAIKNATVQAAETVRDEALLLAAKAADEAEEIESEVDEAVEENDSRTGYTFTGALSSVASMATAPFRAFARVVAG